MSYSLLPLLLPTPSPSSFFSSPPPSSRSPFPSRSLYSPLSLPRRGGVRSKFNFHRVTPLTYHPLCSSPPDSPFPSFPSLHSGNPEDSRKEATGCIPCDKLRGSIIHGNLLRLCLKTLWTLSFLAYPLP